MTGESPEERKVFIKTLPAASGTPDDCPRCKALREHDEEPTQLCMRHFKELQQQPLPGFDRR